MTLVDAREAAAAAIRTAGSTDEIRQVYEIDVITPTANLPQIVRMLSAASDRAVGDAGPSVVAVMARGRRPDQSIELAAFTIVRDRALFKLAKSTRGRGLAVVDTVEGALSGLPTDGLPKLLVQTAATPLSREDSQQNPNVHVFVTECIWPPADPEAPLATEAGSGMDAIRDHMADALMTALPTTEAADVGATEADRRVAVIAGTVPRAVVDLTTKRETIGGDIDLAVISAQVWTDTADDVWRARVAEQLVIAEVKVWHRTEQLADEAIVRLMAELDESVVTWPGSFDARVVSGTSVVTERRTGGQYQQPVDLLNRYPAVWDAEAGLARARVQVQVRAVSQLQPATMRVSGVPLEHDADFKFPS